MSPQRHSQQVLWAALIMLLLVGCGAPAATPTPTLPTPVIVVTSDGNGCTVSGPTELPIGEHLIALKFPATQPHTLYVGRFLDGKTYQDLLDYQGGPGKYPSQPSWVVHPFKMMVGQPASDERVYSIRLNEEGEHVILVTRVTPQRSLWICAPLKVTQASSE